MDKRIFTFFLHYWHMISTTVHDTEKRLCWKPKLFSHNTSRLLGTWYFIRINRNELVRIDPSMPRLHVSLGSCHDLEHWLEVSGVATHGATAEVFRLATRGSRELVFTGHHPCTNTFIIISAIMQNKSFFMDGAFDSETKTWVDSVARFLSPGVVLWPNIPLKKQGSRMLPPMSEPTPMTEPPPAKMLPSPPADRWVKICYLSAIFSQYSQYFWKKM